MDEQSTSDPVHITTCSEELETTMVPHENPNINSTTSEMVHQSDCLVLDSEDQVQPTIITSTETTSAPVDPSTAAPQLIEDSLQSDQVEMPVPVMSNEETNVQTTNELEPVNDGLQNGPQQTLFAEGDLLSDDLDDLSLIADDLDIQCLPSSLTDEHLHHNLPAEEKAPFSEDNLLAASSSDEQQHSQITESATTTSTTTTTTTNATTFQQMELDEPIVETVQFNMAGSSAETEFTEEELKEAPLDLEDLDQLESHGEYSQSTTTDLATLLDTDSSKDGTVSEVPVAAAVSEPEVPDLFKDVKFAISEEMEDLDKIKRALVASGAKFLNYLTDSATHVIADKPEYSFVQEAFEIYEKPVVTSQWVWLSLRSHKLLPHAPFSPFPNRLFSSVVVCPSRLLAADQSAIWSMVTYYGGRYQAKLDGTCTHLVTARISGHKYEKVTAMKSASKCKIVTPDWVVDCVKKMSLLDEERYHPRLLITYNEDKKGLMNDRKKRDSGEKQSMVDEETAIFTKTTKSVTMAISTAAVLSRKVEPFKLELATTSPTAPPMITSPPLVLTPLPNNQNSTTTTSNANVQIHHHPHHHSVPNSSITSMTSTSMLSPRQMQNPQALHHQQQQQFHSHAAHPHPHQQSNVQLMNHGGQMNVATTNAYQQHQPHGLQNRHMTVHQGGQNQMQQQQMQMQQLGQHLGPGAMHPQQGHPPHLMNNQQQQTQNLTAAQKRKQNAAAAGGQVNAVKSKGPGSKGPSKAALKKQQQQLQVQQQQHLHQHAHSLPQEHGVHQMDPTTMMAHGGAPGMQPHPVSQAGYHPNQGVMPSQQQPPHSQMVNNQTMHSPTQYRQTPQGPMVGQQQMGGMVSQAQSLPVQHVQGGGVQQHPQQNAGPRGPVYLAMNQSQQSMQFVNGQGQFVRGQFIARPQQQQHQPQQMMSPGQQQQMYRHPAQNHQQFATMQQQQQSQQTPQQRAMAYGTQGQMAMSQQGQSVYVGQHQQAMQHQQRMQMPPQQQHSPQQQVSQHQSPTGQPTVNAGQQAMMSQNQYGQMQSQSVHQQQQEGSPSVAGSSISPGAVVSPVHGPYPQQQHSPGIPRMPMNMIRMSSLTPEQQQQILQQQKMQQQHQAGYQGNMQQTGHMGGQPIIRPNVPMGVNSGQSSPHTPPQMLSPNGTPVPQRMMMMRPTMVQQGQQQVYGQQMVDPTKLPVQQQQQQAMVRPPVAMQAQQGLLQQGPQQFVQQGQQQQQVQFIRQRWPMSAGDQQFPGNKAHPQFVTHMGGPGGPPRQMIVSQQQQQIAAQQIQQGPPPHLNPQQQQMWLQQRQRFLLQQQQQLQHQQQQHPQARMVRMNGPMMMQQQQMAPQSPMHPSMMGLGPDGQHSKVRMNNSSQQQHSNTEVVSTNITAVVGGGVDTVIASSAPAVISQAIANQQQQANAVGGMVGSTQVQTQVNSAEHANLTRQQVSQHHSQQQVNKTILVQQQGHQQGQHHQTQQNISGNASHQQQQYSVPAGTTSSSNSSANSSSASTPTSTTSGSVVNEKTKTALANLLNNRLNQQQNGQLQQQQSPTATTATSSATLVLRDQASVGGVSSKQSQQGQVVSGAGTSSASVQSPISQGAMKGAGQQLSTSVGQNVAQRSLQTTASTSGNSMTQQHLQQQHSVDALPMTTATTSVGNHGDMASHALQGHHGLSQQQTPQSSQIASPATPNNGQSSQMVPGQAFPGSGAISQAQQQPPPPPSSPFPGATQTLAGQPHHLQQQHHSTTGRPSVPPLNGHVTNMNAAQHHQLPSHQQATGGAMVRTFMQPGSHQGFGGFSMGSHNHPSMHTMHLGPHQHPLPSQSNLINAQQQQGTNGPQQALPNVPGTVCVPAMASAHSQPQTQQHQHQQTPHPPQLQTIQIRFYGHEQRMVIPREVCLIGCVFYIAPSYSTENEATSRLVNGWRRRIERYGGRVVDQYVPGPGNYVTHVVTENMNGGVVKLALSENRRCVSVFWLDDTLGNERLLPPWRFYHLPFACGPAPCKNMIISTSNFDSEERKMMKQLIQRTGAVYTDYLTSKNTVLICKKLEGSKYERAVHWRVAIVNLLWLQDVLFGHTESLQLSKLPPKYQTFEESNCTKLSVSTMSSMTPAQMLLGDTFRVDYTSARAFMAPWRFPIRFDDEEMEMKMEKVREEQRRKRQLEDEEKKEKMRLEDERRLREQMEQQKELEMMIAEASVPKSTTIKVEEPIEKTTMEVKRPSELSALLDMKMDDVEENPAPVATKRSFDEMNSAPTEGGEIKLLTNGPISLEKETTTIEEPTAKRQKLTSEVGQTDPTTNELRTDQPMESTETPSEENAINKVHSSEVEIIDLSDETVASATQKAAEPIEKLTASGDIAADVPESVGEVESSKTEPKCSTEDVVAMEVEADEEVQVEKPAPTLSELLSETDEPDIIIERQPAEVNNKAVDQRMDDEVFESASDTNNNSLQQQQNVIPLVVSELSENNSLTRETSSVSFKTAKVPTPNVPTSLSFPCSSSSILGGFTTPPLPLPPRVSAISILFTAVDGGAESRQELHSIVDSLGGKVVTDAEKCSHLVADHVLPTVKYLCAFARARHVLHSDWLRACGQAGAFLDEAPYTLVDQSGEATYKVDLARAMAERSSRLFKDTVFLLTRSIVPSPTVIARIVQANGGAAVFYRPPNGRQLAKLQANNFQFVVVSCPTDLHTCDRFFDSQIKVVTVQCIINAILRQQVDFEGHSLQSIKEQQQALASFSLTTTINSSIATNGNICSSSGASPMESNIGSKQFTPCSTPPPLLPVTSSSSNSGSSSFADFLAPPAASTRICPVAK